MEGYDDTPLNGCNYGNQGIILFPWKHDIEEQFWCEASSSAPISFDWLRLLYPISFRGHTFGIKQEDRTFFSWKFPKGISS